MHLVARSRLVLCSFNELRYFAEMPFGTQALFHSAVSYPWVVLWMVYRRGKVDIEI